MPRCDGVDCKCANAAGRGLENRSAVMRWTTQKNYIILISEEEDALSSWGHEISIDEKPPAVLAGYIQMLLLYVCSGGGVVKVKEAL